MFIPNLKWTVVADLLASRYNNFGASPEGLALIGISVDKRCQVRRVFTRGFSAPVPSDEASQYSRNPASASGPAVNNDLPKM